MKEYTFAIDKWQAQWIFAPVRSKLSIIKLLMRTVKVMLVNAAVDEKDTTGKIILRVSKMSRIFYYSENKYFSIQFPFSVTESDDGLRFYSSHIDRIDSKVTSEVLSIVTNSNVFDAPEPLDFIEPVDEIFDSNPNFWEFLRSLLLFEGGYVRYDYDIIHTKDKVHPLNHVDVFYSSNSTFKLGIHSRIPLESMIDCLDLESDCHFLDTK
ncbi:MAG: hypothetical protein KC421_23540 [Anaerolineales bacterium]|nr:hypothetical protein [Anaerolineales bacterium]